MDIRQQPDRRRELKERFVRERGYFLDWNEILLEHDPDLLERTMQFAAAAAGRRVIPDRLRHMIWIAVDSVVTHMFPFGADVHARQAIAAGATPAELMEVLALVSGASGIGLETALPIIEEEAERAGEASGRPSGLSAKQEELKQEIVASLGEVPDWMEPALRLAPDYLRALFELGRGGGAESSLTEKERQLILLAIHACPANLAPAAIRRHSRWALECGADRDELVEVVQLASGIGIHGFFICLPAMKPHLTPGDDGA